MRALKGARIVVGVVAAAVTFALIAALYWLVTVVVAPPADGAGRTTASAVVDGRVLFVQLLGAILVMVGLVFSARTYDHSVRSQRLAAFAKAVDQLANEASPTAVAGGLQALAVLVSHDPSYWEPTDRIVGTLIRSRGRTLGGEARSCLELLGSRRRVWNARKTPLDLRGADLAELDLGGLNLVQARLDGASLAGARFTDAKLSGACFDNAFAEGCEFAGAILEGASAAGAVLRGCGFEGAMVDGMNIDGAVLDGARGLDPDVRAAMIGTPRSELASGAAMLSPH